MPHRRPMVLWSLIAVLGIGASATAAFLWQSRPDDGPAGQPLATIRAQAGAAPTAASDPSPAPSTPAPAPVAAEPSARAADPAAVAAEQSVISTPVRIVVESLGIDASVDPVGVQDDGSMTIPKSASRVGWYSYGSAPGDPEGNTVIAGHVDTAADGPGAMYRLREADVGDRIVVQDAAGVSHEYEVAGKENVVKAALPVEQVFAREGTPLLVLVTCGGEFQPELRSYRDNLIVTAVPVESAAPAP